MKKNMNSFKITIVALGVACFFTSCQKEIVADKVTADLRTITECAEEWFVDEESMVGYSYAELTITEPGTYVMNTYAELEAVGSQGITWVFEGVDGSGFELTDTDPYYQSFNTGPTGLANFFTMWTTPHTLTFSVPGTLTVRKYDAFKVSHRVCVERTSPMVTFK